LETEDSTYSSDRFVSSLECDLNKNTINCDELKKEEAFTLFDSPSFTKRRRRDSSPSTLFSSSERITRKKDLLAPYIQREEVLTMREGGHGNELEAIFF